MSTYLQVTLGIITAWLFVALIGSRMIRRATRADAERLKVTGMRALAAAVADELERRSKERERRDWH